MVLHKVNKLYFSIKEIIREPFDPLTNLCILRVADNKNSILKVSAPNKG